MRSIRQANWDLRACRFKVSSGETDAPDAPPAAWGGSAAASSPAASVPLSCCCCCCWEPLRPLPTPPAFLEATAPAAVAAASSTASAADAACLGEGCRV